MISCGQPLKSSGRLSRANIRPMHWTVLPRPMASQSNPPRIVSRSSRLTMKETPSTSVSSVSSSADHRHTVREENKARAGQLVLKGLKLENLQAFIHGRVFGKVLQRVLEERVETV